MGSSVSSARTLSMSVDAAEGLVFEFIELPELKRGKQNSEKSNMSSHLMQTQGSRPGMKLG